MAVKGWYLTQIDGSSGTGGAVMGSHQMVTFTASSGLTPEGSSSVELIFNDAKVLNKADLLRAIERIQYAIVNETWPPSGQN